MTLLTLRASRARLCAALAACASTVLLGGCGGDYDKPAAAGGVVPVAALAASAGATGVVVADAPLPRPATAACEVPLFTAMTYSGFDAHPFSYAGSAACPGPWAKVVLEADFSVNAGRQFDRTASISIGGVNLYFGTTQEPSATVAPGWHVERDLTDVAAALTAAATGYVRLDNVVDATYTGLIQGSAKLVFHPAARATDAAVARMADAVIPFAGDLATGDPANLASAGDSLSRTLSLPTNMVRLYLDVLAESQGGDEFWYTCVPDALAGTLQSCGGGSFREVLVTIDGQPAGLAPVVPRVYTGGIDPGLWRPTPGAETLAFVPSRVDLTPFSGALSDGAPHTVAISVEGAQDHYAVVANLLVYRDPGAATTSGAVVGNSLAGAALPAPVVTDGTSTGSDGSVSGVLGVKAARHYTVMGWVDTSGGRLTTTVEQQLAFDNEQTFRITDAVYSQAVAQTSTVDTAVTTTRDGSSTVDRISSSYPLNLAYVYDNGASRQDTTASQHFANTVSRVLDGRSVFDSSFENAIDAKSGLVFDSSGNASRAGQAGTQSVTYTDSIGSCYARTVTTALNALVSVADAASCDGGNRLNWLAQPDGAPSQGVLAQLAPH